MVAVIHINDNRLAIQSENGVFYSQGYAWLKDDKVIFDLNDADSAVGHCRLSPQQINNRYWLQCEQSAIPANGAGMRHAADLIWQHLSQLKQKHQLNEVVFVVPSHYRQANLQLLLGIAKACQLKVRGLVNKAIVALHNNVDKDGKYLHFDVQLHQTIASELIVENGQISLGDIEILNDVGIQLMQEALLKGLQNNFIQNDRFDPLHDAATEQQLFDQLGAIAKQLEENGKASIGLQHQGRLHNTSLDSKEWHGLLYDFANQLINASQSSKSSFVDLNAAFDGAGLDMLYEAGFAHLDQTPAMPAAQLIQNTDDESIIYRTDIPIGAKNATVNELAKPDQLQARPKNAEVENLKPKVAASGSHATHLLCAGKAVAIEQAKVSIDQGVLNLSPDSSANVEAQLQKGQLFILNDEGRHELMLNDRLGSHLADGVISVIQVL